ncbi:ArpU family phage packaging/lysis transcriptional regulator [Bacillus smithii]|uniref:ArpU family phage packaging/lysis transcriptional regulator n=1 Tax=Bacillus smithii TaxID=1479 RepID=UPI000AE7B69A
MHLLLLEPTKEQENLLIKKVLKEFKKYERSLWVLEEKQYPKITSTYTYDESQRPLYFSHSSTESTVLANIEAYEFCVSILKKLERLKPEHRIIIYEYYLRPEKEKRSVSSICEELHVTESHFHRMKRTALIILGYAMGFAVEEIDESETEND